MQSFSLEKRSLEVLAATIRTYVNTAEPVGSRTISRQRNDRLSAATIRNIMSDLEEAGYLEQPHTSAGRVPTEKAYRLYVEQIARPAQLSASDADLIRDEMHCGATESTQAVLEHASHALSMVTRNVGIVLPAAPSDAVLRNIHFVLLADQRVLVVVTPRGAPIRNRVIRIDRQFKQDELDRIANYLNANFTGWRLAAARNEIARRLEEERALYDELLRHLAALWRQGILDADAVTGLYLEGASHLMERPELDNPRLLRDLLRALEEKERLVELLTRYIQSADSSAMPMPQVFIGLDAAPPVKDFALIGAVCCTAEGPAGRVAVLGPPRMQYEQVICAVAHVAQLVGEALADR